MDRWEKKRGAERDKEKEYGRIGNEKAVNEVRENIWDRTKKK